MKGITPVIAIVLLLLITISIIGFTATFFQSAVTTSGQQAQSGAAQQEANVQKTIELVAMAGNTVTLKNIGTVPISSSDISVLVSGNPVTVTGNTMNPGQSQTFTISDASVAVGRKNIVVAAPGNIVNKNIKFSDPKNCKEYIGTLDAHGDGLYNITPAGSPIEVYCDMTTDGGGWTLTVRAKAGSEAHETSAAVGILSSPTQSAVAKLDNAMIITIGKSSSSVYETRFLFDSFSDRYYHQWNNGYAADFSNAMIPVGGSFQQTRKSSYAGSYVNEAVAYWSGCGGSHAPFDQNEICDPLWEYDGCHTGFGIYASCANPWAPGHPEDSMHRSGTMWVR